MSFTNEFKKYAKKHLYLNADAVDHHVDSINSIPGITGFTPQVIEESFLRANPQLSEDQITVTCRAGHIQEVRICLTKDLTSRTCGVDVRKDCTAPSAIFEPMR